MDEPLPPRRQRSHARLRSRAAVRPPETVAAESRIFSGGPFSGERALVLGGSVAGLLAARVLAEHFERVTVIERDYLYERPIGRKGVPQARHSHILLASGAAVIRELLPELDLTAAGAVAVDSSQDLRWFHFGVWKTRFPSGIILYLTNRMVLETAIRSEVRRWANIEFVDDCQVVGLRSADGGRRIIGVDCQRKGEGEILTYDGELVVDATGRGSRSPRWLAELGRSRVPAVEVRMNIGYASRVYRIPKGFPLDRLPLAVFPKPPETRRMGLMYSIDDKILMVTLGGWCRDYPPTKADGFVTFAESLEVESFAGLLREAKPAPAIHAHLVPSSLRHRYEAMPDFPDGYLVVGDALCSFNPIYGQGMSTAALEIQALRGWLSKARRRGRRPRSGDGRRLQRRVARKIALPWLLATTEDLRFPEVVGPRRFGLRFLQWYVGAILELSATHPEILRRFMLVMNLLAGPLVLVTPGILWRVLWHTVRRRWSAARSENTRAATSEAIHPATPEAPAEATPEARVADPPPPERRPERPEEPEGPRALRRDAREGGIGPRFRERSGPQTTYAPGSSP